MTVAIFVGDKQLSMINNDWWRVMQWIDENAPDCKSWRLAIELVIQSYVVNKNLPELKKQLQEVHSKMPDELKPKVEYLIEGVEYGIKNNYHFGVEFTQEEIEVYEGEDKTPKNAREWNNKGDGLYSLKRYDEAVECYIKTIELDPKATETEAWNDLDSLIGDTLFKKGMYDKMIEYCDKLLKLDPGKAMIWCDKAEALRGLEQDDEATKCYEKAVHLDPENKNIKKAWERKKKDKKSEEKGCEEEQKGKKEGMK